jgi:hypothetical protein
MAVPLECPNCDDNLGKDKENGIAAWCGRCGTEFFNEYGYETDDEGNDIPLKKWLRDNPNKFSKKQRSGNFR